MSVLDRANKASAQLISMCKPPRSVHPAVVCRFAFVENGQQRCVLYDKPQALCDDYMAKIRETPSS